MNVFKACTASGRAVVLRQGAARPRAARALRLDALPAFHSFQDMRTGFAFPELASAVWSAIFDLAAQGKQFFKDAKRRERGQTFGLLP